MGAKAGDYRPVADQRTRAHYKVRGVLKDSGDTGGLVLMDIAAAQRAVKRTNRVDRILLTVPAQPSLEQWEQRIRAALPAGVELRREGAKPTRIAACSARSAGICGC